MKSANDNVPTVEAVLLFKGADVVEQMLYSEFEGVLDHVTCLPDYSDTNVKGCYVRVQPNLTISGIVFFAMDFDEHGYADRSWNLPLRRLMSMAGQGPDLGAGPIHLVCRTRCPQPDLREELWDPSIQPGMNHFQILKKAIEKNELNVDQRLAVGQNSLADCVDIPVVTDEASSDIKASSESARLTSEHRTEASVFDAQAMGDQKAHRVKLAEIIKNQRFRIEALTNECEDKVNELERVRRHDQIQFNEHKRLYAQKFERLKVKYLKREQQLNNSVALIARLLDVEDAEVIKEHLDDLRAIGNFADLAGADGKSDQMELIQTKAENYLLTQQLVQLKRVCNSMNQKMREKEQQEMPDVPTVIGLESKKTG